MRNGKKIGWLIGVTCVAVMTLAAAWRGAFAGSEEIPSLLPILRDLGPMDFCGETVPVDDPEVRERLEKELLLALWDRPQVILWLKRSSRYLPYIEEKLKEGRLPDDLKYVAVIESALRPRVVSRRGAAGFWQFVEDTGRKYGLVINERIDQRRSFKASTEAAVRYFQALYETLGSWTLAAAGYNMGEEGLIAETMEQETRDYYQLYLPGETQRYVFRVLSAKLILGAPETFGFVLTDQDFYPPIEGDMVCIDNSDDIALRIVADAAKTHFKEIKDLNPEILGHYLPSGDHCILVPKGASAGFPERYKTLVQKFLTARKEQVYVVKKGDNLTVIAERFGVPLAALIIWNRLDPTRPIHPGLRLFVYPDGAEEKPPVEKEPSGQGENFDHGSLQNGL